MQKIILTLALIIAVSQSHYFESIPFPIPRDSEIEQKEPTRYRVNVEANYFEKWTEVFSDADNRQKYQQYVRQLKEKMLDEGFITPIWYSFISNYSQYYKYYDEEMVDEMRVISLLSLVDFADVFTANFVYEIVAHRRSKSNMCSAFLVWGEDDIVKHIKNFDFNGADALGKIMIQFDYVNDDDELVFSTSQNVGFIAAGTAIRYGAYSMTINERNKGEIMGSFMEMVFGGWNVQYHILTLLKTVDNYDEFIMNIIENRYIAPFYLTVASAKAGEGGILIQKGRNKETQVVALSKKNWVIVQTNCDINEEDPDQRRTIATQKIKDLGREASFEQLYQVAQEYPTFNNITISTYLMSPQTDLFNTTIWYI